jgi:hypothetical protein
MSLNRIPFQSATAPVCDGKPGNADCVHWCCWSVFATRGQRGRHRGQPTLMRTALVTLIMLVARPGYTQAPHTPVLVELFTAEGCSSCPPADALLAKLDREQPIAGVTVIALEEHVDYWDRQGWRDPFSSPQFTARQQQYSGVLGVENIYTPEMVIDGRHELVGNDGPRAWSEIAKEAQATKAAVNLAVMAARPDRISLSVKIDGVDTACDVVLAITEDNLASAVTAGENAGRNLKHAAVVRRLSVVGRIKAGEPFSAEPVVKLAKAWMPENLRAVVFAQDRATKGVLGAAEVKLGR